MQDWAWGLRRSQGNLYCRLYDIGKGDSVKVIRLEVRVHPKPGAKRGRMKPGFWRTLRIRLFGFVEGDIYSYQVTVRNVGDEAISQKDIWALRFRW